MNPVLQSAPPPPVREQGDPHAHLPAAYTRRWVPRHKAAVVEAVRSGLLTLQEAGERYMLTEDEFLSWARAIDEEGLAGLRATLSDRRKAPRQAVAEAGAVMLCTNARFECLITDISDRGARLQFKRSVSLVSPFELHFERSDRSWPADLLWQRGRVAGVGLINPLHPPWTIKSGLAGWLLGARRTVTIDRS
jgi:hypothetical protein